MGCGGANQPCMHSLRQVWGWQGVQMVSDDFTMQMTNTPSTVDLIDERVIKDFTGAPPSMRRSAGADQIAYLQHVCRAF